MREKISRHFLLVSLLAAALPSAARAAGTAWLAYPDGGRIVALPLDRPGDASVVAPGGASGFAPSLALGDVGLPAVAWLAEDGAVAFSRFDGRSWSAPETVCANRGSNRGLPTLVAAGGPPAVAWAEEAGGGFEDVFYALRSGNGWGAPVRAHEENAVPDIMPSARAGAGGARGLSWQTDVGSRYVERRIGAAVPPPDAGALPPGLAGDFLAAGAPLETAVAWRAEGGAPCSMRLKELLDAEGEASEGPERSLSAAGAADRISLIAFGDSITFGRGSRSNGPATGYPAYLAGILLYNYQGQEFKMVNKGVPGETTAVGLGRIDSVLDRYPSDFILIMEGTNDIFFGVSFNTIQSNLKKMALRAGERGITPVLATIIPTLPYGARASQYQRTRAFYYGGYVQSLAGRYGLRCADQWRAFTNVPGWPTEIMDRATGNHPNENGYRYVMAPEWYEALAPILGLPFDPSGPQIDVFNTPPHPGRGSSERFTYELEPSNDQVRNAVDCYAAILTPQGKLLYFNPAWHLTEAVTPFARKALLSAAPTSGVLTDLRIPPDASFGRYKFYLVTVRAMMDLWETKYWTSNLAEVDIDLAP